MCDFCHSVVARTDYGLQATGRMAELLEIPTPFSFGATGTWGGEPFEVIGRVQMDRAGAPGAPWQETLLWFSHRDTTTWVASAQGRWYVTNQQAVSAPLPSFTSLRPASQVDLASHGLYVVAEIGHSRVVSGEGSLPNVPSPGAVTRYVDVSGPQGAFGTIDYGDGSGEPVLYLGRQFDPQEIQLDSGLAVASPEAKVSAADCPNCGASLPITSERSERIICQYYGTKSDISHGHLSALGPAPRPPIQPYIPLGSRGNLRGIDYVVTGFAIRSCMVGGQKYAWREYLLYGGESAGYKWLMEEDGKWTFVEPFEAGMVSDGGQSVMFNGQMYGLKQQVTATIDYVIGEFYWKVEIGETVHATDFQGAGGKVSREQSPTEVNYSFVSDLAPHELAAFGVQPPSAFSGFGGGDFSELADFGTSSSNTSSSLGTVIFVMVMCIIFGAMSDCGGGSGSYYGGGSFSK